jgi:hypothetical protein
MVVWYTYNVFIIELVYAWSSTLAYIGTYTAYTTGDTCFPECQMHSGKAKKHLGKPSPSATLGEEPPGMRFT